MCVRNVVVVGFVQAHIESVFRAILEPTFSEEYRLNRLLICFEMALISNAD
jgi:hypothetical protein